MTSGAVPRLAVDNSRRLVSALDELPAVRDYLNRVGASLKGLRRAVVEGDREGGYLTERAEIRFTPDGAITAPSGYEPTQAEQAGIRAALEGVRLPAAEPFRHMGKHLPGPGQVPWAIADPDDLAVCWDRKREQILFVQERRCRKDPKGHATGDKYYVPWTYFDDGKWRQTEPDSLLPLWGLDQIGSHTSVIVHEGAKAAQFCARLISDADEGLYATSGPSVEARKRLLDHPLRDLLEAGPHLGWLGGAPNAHCTDWAALRLAGVKQVILVCDNDRVGKDASSRISLLCGLPMRTVFFDDRFPLSFDLADPVPSSLYKCTADGGRSYCGPRTRDLLSTATWATRRLEPEGRGRPSHDLRPEFLGEWFVVNQPLCIVRSGRPEELLSDAQFNSAVRPYSHVDDTARLLRRYPSAFLDGLAYDPGMPAGQVSKDGRRLFNTHSPPVILGDGKGDPQPWFEFLEQVFPVADDRHQVMRWCATLIAKPETRMAYGLLLMSETQGVGKTTLGEELLAPLVGRHNTSIPEESQVTEANFNGFLARKRLVIVSEIYAGDNRKAYNRLKRWVTDTTVQINEKYREAYELPNWAHFLACSNSKRALAIEDTDRRWLVPTVTEDVWAQNKWDAFYGWLAGDGLSIVRRWAGEFAARHAVKAGERAPTTSAKQALILDTMGEGRRLVMEFGEELVERSRSGEKLALFLHDVREWLAAEKGSADKLEGERVIADTLRKVGGLHFLHRDKRPSVSGVKRAVLVNFDPGDLPWSEIKLLRKSMAELGYSRPY